MLNRHSVWTKTALFSVFLTLLAVPAMSQSFYGSLVSVVSDAQGGVIPGATVMLDQHRDERTPRGRERGRWDRALPESRARHLPARGRADGLPALRARRDRSQRAVGAPHRGEAAARQPVRDGSRQRRGAGAADRKRVGRHCDGEQPHTAVVAERRQRAQPDYAGAFRRAARRQRREPDGQERVRGWQLPDRRRHGEPERVLLRRRHGAGFGLRQHRRADAEPGGGRRVPRADQQQQRRVRPLHRRRRQHRLALGHQHSITGQHLRTTPQQGAQLEHVLRRARRPRQAAVRAEQLRRVDGRSGAHEQAVLLRQFRRLPQPRRRAVPPHGADGRDEER